MRRGESRSPSPAPAPAPGRRRDGASEDRRSRSPSPGNFSEADTETRQIMQSRVNPSVREKYESQNIKFMLWLFDSHNDHRQFLAPALLEALPAAHEKDLERRTESGAPSKKRDHVRDTCRAWLQQVDSQRPDTYPIKLKELTYTVYARYLNTFKKRVKKRDAEGGFVLVRLSPSAFDGAISALSHLFTECGLAKTVSAESKNLWTQLATYKQGSRRTAASEKKKLGLSAVEGKKHLPFAAYRKLATILFEGQDSAYVAAHAFLVLEWNLISRAEYLVDAKIDLVSFTEDALLFNMGVTKTDQEGVKNVDHPWHVYSCPEYPEICAHLAVARLIMANPEILNGQTKLFDGKSQYERFNGLFRRIVSSDEHRGDFASLGISPEDFGTHSIRKGAATHVATGSTACPPIACICLRANWAMPGVMNRYIKYENAGDQFVGKCVSGRSRNSTMFAASSSYWDFSAEDAETGESQKAELKVWLIGRLPEEAKNNERIYAVHKMAVAAIAFHRDYLQDHLHPESPLRSSSIWNDAVPFQDKVVVKYPWNETVDTPKITGLPPDVILLSKLEKMKREMDTLKADLQASFESTLTRQLDEREVGGSGFARGNEIIGKLDALLETVNKAERAAAQASSQQPAAEDPVEFDAGGGCVSDDDEEEDIAVALDEPENMPPRKRARIIQRRTNEQLAARTITVGFHHGHLNPLPSSWKYPKHLTVIQLINLWLVGAKEEKVPALRKLITKHVLHFDEKGKTRSKMRTVMKEIEHLARLDNVWREGRWDSPDVIKMWSTIWPRLKPLLRTVTKRGNRVTDEKSRQGQISWWTVYNKFVRHGKNWLPSKIVRAGEDASDEV